MYTTVSFFKKNFVLKIFNIILKKKKEFYEIFCFMTVSALSLFIVCVLSHKQNDAQMSFGISKLLCEEFYEIVCFRAIIAKLLKVIAFNNLKHYLIYLNTPLYNTSNTKCFILTFNTLK